MTVNRFSLLRSPIFLISLAILVLNDFVLKATFHNWLTGKLSDFSGLAAFTLFCCAVRPKQLWLVGAAISAAFLYWKSSYSQGLIDLANGYLPFQIGRTVDYTDLVALPVVWLVCKFAPHLPLWKMRQLQVLFIAGVSLAAFTGTTVINRHAVRETAEIGVSQDPLSAARTETELQQLLDSMAERHGMHCTICDTLSKGRVYSINDNRPSPLSLTANYDSTRSVVLYVIGTSSLNGPVEKERAKEVDSLQMELQNALRSSYPSLRVAVAAYPHAESIGIGVWKKERFTSYRDKANQDDYNTALGVVRNVATHEGLQQVSDSLYSVGRLFGPSPYDRDLVVSVGIADSPLVVISIYCHSQECGERHLRLARELERRLQETFGTDRASIR